MSDRTEYYKKYNAEHREKRKIYFRKHYEENLEDRLTYQKKYDKIHVEERMAKLKLIGQNIIERLGVIHKVFKKWGSAWKQSVDGYQDFKNWAERDPEYNRLYDAWKASGFEKGLSPVCMRIVKKKGFVVGNLEWKVRSDYSWWSREQELREQIEEELDAEQAVKNKGTKEDQKRARYNWANRDKGGK